MSKTTRNPEMVGPAGKAWLLDVNKMDMSKRPPDHAACLSLWLVEVPGITPVWRFWQIAVVHLRPLPNVPPAKLDYPEAEYEFMILALSHTSESGIPTIEDVELDTKGWVFLEPIDFVKQFHGISDEQVRSLVAYAVHAIVHGQISPDSDYRKVWDRVIDTTVRHFKEGKHPVQ